MTIEVKQLIVKSTVTQGECRDKHAAFDARMVDDLKERLMAECRELIAEKLDELKER